MGAARINLEPLNSKKFGKQDSVFGCEIISSSKFMFLTCVSLSHHSKVAMHNFLFTSDEHIRVEQSPMSALFFFVKKTAMPAEQRMNHPSFYSHYLPNDFNSPIFRASITLRVKTGHPRGARTIVPSEEPFFSTRN